MMISQVPAIESIYQATVPTRDRSIKMILSLMGSSAVLLGLAICMRGYLPAPLKSALLGAAAGSSAIATAYAGLEQTRKTSKFARAAEVLQDEQLKDALRHNAAYDKCLNQMEGQYRLAEVLQRLPVQQRVHFARQFGVEQLVEIPLPPQPKTIEVKAEPVRLGNGQVAIASQIAQTRQQGIDYSWLNDEVIKASKGVFGAKGSGKSFYLALEAWEFKRANPDGTLIIIDKHYDPQPGLDKSSFDPKLSLWFLGLPDEIIRRDFVVSLMGDPDGKHAGREAFCRRIVEVFRLVKAVGIARQQPGSGGKSAPMFKLIFDEFAGTMVDIKQICGASAVDEIVSTIQFIEFECRKFNMRTTLGLHSLKKETIGIDSNVLLGNMDLMFLGSALADPNTKFPADISVGQTLEAQQALQNSLEPGEGFACAYRPQGKKICVQVLPHINPLDLWFDAEGFESGQSSIATLTPGITSTSSVNPPAKPDSDSKSSTKESGDRSTGSSPDSSPDKGAFKPRDLNKSNPIQTIFDVMREWYVVQPSKPTDEELAAKWHELRNGDCPDLSSKDLQFLRDKLEGK